MMTAPQAGATPYTPVPQPAPAAPPAAAPTPTRQNPPVAEKNRIKNLFKGLGSNKIEADVSESSENSFYSDTGRRMVTIAIGFLIFYLLLMWAILQNDYNRGQNSIYQSLADSSAQSATHISNVFGNVGISIDAGLSEGSSPAQAARLIAKAPSIDGAAILDAQSNVISKFPNDIDFLSDLSLAGIQSNTLDIQSSRSLDKGVTTLVVKKTGNYFTVAAVSSEVLNLGSEGETQSVVTTRSEKVIAGGHLFGKNGVSDGLGIKPSKFQQLTGIGQQSSVRLKVDGQKRFVSSTHIPNTDLFLLSSNTQQSFFFFKKESNFIPYTVLGD